MTDIAPQYINLDTLIHNRLFRIPQYQRTYSWRSKQRIDLFDDIKRIHSQGNNRSHFMATIVGLRRDRQTIITTEHQIVEIVDGQQRITTLILLLNAIWKSADDSDDIQAKIKQEIHESLVKDDNATLLLLQTNHDSSNYFADYIRRGTHPSSMDAKTIADREILSAMEECEQFVADWQKDGNSLIDLVNLLKNRLTFILHEISDEELVYTVFEVLNSRGLAVSWFDRLKSMLMAIVFESPTGTSETIDEIHRLWTEIYRCVGLRFGLSTESLRFAATLQNPVCPNRTMGEEDAALQLSNQSKDGPDRAIETTGWIKRVIDAVDKLRTNRRNNAVTGISQARMVATAVYLREDLTEDQKDKVLQRWEKVTFRIYGMFEKDARWAIGDYVRLAWSIINDKLSADTILKRLSEIGEEFPIDGAVECISNTDCYTNWTEELRYFLYKYEEYLAKKADQNFNNSQWDRIWESSAADSIEHIRPKNSYDGPSGKDPEWNDMHRLGNLTLLPPRLNSKLQDTSALKKSGCLY